MMYDAIAPLAMLAILAIAVSAFIICARRDTEAYEDDEDDFLNFLIESDQI